MTSAGWCQKAPGTSSLPWAPPPAGNPALPSRDASTRIDPDHIYTLAELTSLAEEFNPSTRAAWEAAKLRARDLRVAESELLPTLVAAASADTTRQNNLVGDSFSRATVSFFTPFLLVNYTVLDFGARGSRIAEARDRLLGADFAFNAAHLGIIFEAARRYYSFLNAQGVREAAQATLANSQTLESAIHARMTAGLATVTDELEAKSATAEAGYQLEAASGEVDLARGDLLVLLGAHPLDPLRVQPLREIQVPESLGEEPQAAIDKALTQRPEILERATEELAARQGIRGARSDYLPKLVFRGLGGEQRLNGQQDQMASVYEGPSEAWNVTLRLEWTIFDGGRREAELARSHDQVRAAEAETKRTEDDIEQGVWTAYIALRTALRQRNAATSLLTASQAAYDSAAKSYQLGLRSVVDVVAAQRSLAQARSQDVTARTAVLLQLANLSFQTGDLLGRSRPRPTP